MVRVKLPKQKRHVVANFMIMALCGLITLYVFASSYETVFNRDLPYLPAVSAVNLQSVTRALDGYKNVNQTVLGNYGVPQFLKLPLQSVKITLVPGIENDGKFLARAASAHYFMTKDSKNGTVGDLVVYFEKSWRTDDNPEKIKVGDNIFLDTDRDWRYFYRIESVNIQDNSTQYVARESNVSQLLLVGVDTSANKVVIAQATLVNVQSVRL
jgi:hypothetical protein